jgi:high-affinity iron transporter
MRWAGLIILLLAGLLAAPPAFANEQARKLVALLDYLGSDYKNAVQNGKIVSQDEYQEMQEFSKSAFELMEKLKKEGDTSGIEPGVKALAAAIEGKGDPKTVASLANGAKTKLIAAYGIVPHPKTLPALANGNKIYVENCAQCHGRTGHGDGPSRQTMEPKTPAPANFQDPDRMGGLSPFKAFNTATYGIQGTAMASFAALTEQQRWDVAFYLFSLRFSPESARAGAALLETKNVTQDVTSVATLATHSDEELLEELRPYVSEPSEREKALAYLRRGLLEQNSADPLVVARARLHEASELYVRGVKESAYQKAVEAYLDGFELAEPALFAKDAGFARMVEGEFTQLRNAIKQGASTREIQSRVQDIDGKLDEARRLLTRQDGLSNTYAFLNSALIILREGLEAALIVAAILAALQVLGAGRETRYIHMGWILAIAAGILTWIAAETILTLSGRHRESLEGFVSVFAAVALFYVGYWLHTHAEVKKWRSFVDQKVKTVVSTRKVWGLVGISFFAVYREAFEVVLFYQALWLQSESNRAPVISGFIAGSSALIVLALAIFKLGLRLPLKYFFGATGTLLYILAFVFAGTGIKELQAAGWVPSTPVSFPLQVPFLGIYPTVETLAAQMAMLVAFIMTSVWMTRPNGKLRMMGKNP